ncbi:hypothetical protein GCM10011575_42610 [Microlunatus endophyticus]|uniref:Uncharacterized protein n=1 Tax=Microlunatus endophyticus TaxID=1716077 RepID=A0A917W8P9_9ACTN|nr:hypothetical protein GCM10011575_42610 [Microlunatus endophyticus]
MISETRGSVSEQGETCAPRALANTSELDGPNHPSAPSATRLQAPADHIHDPECQLEQLRTNDCSRPPPRVASMVPCRVTPEPGGRPKELDILAFALRSP